MLGDEVLVVADQLLHMQRQPEGGNDANPHPEETGSSDPYHSDRNTVDQNLLVEDRGALAEPLTPVVVAQDGDGATLRMVVLGSQQTAKSWMSLKSGKEIAGDELAGLPVRFGVDQV